MSMRPEGVFAEGQELVSLRFDNAKLATALREIAAQNLSSEVDSDGEGDFEFAYDAIVKIARSALGLSPERKNAPEVQALISQPGAVK